VTRFQRLLEDWRAGNAELAPIVGLVGIRPVSFSEGRAELALAAERRHHNAMGTVHGGVLCDLADVAMGCALAGTLADDEAFTTVELSARYLRSVRDGELTARASVVHRGRGTAVVECEIVDAEGRLVAKVASTCVILRGRTTEG